MPLPGLIEIDVPDDSPECQADTWANAALAAATSLDGAVHDSADYYSRAAVNRIKKIDKLLAASQFMSPGSVVVGGDGQSEIVPSPLPLPGGQPIPPAIIGPPVIIPPAQPPPPGSLPPSSDGGIGDTVCFHSPPPECPEGYHPVWDEPTCSWCCVQDGGQDGTGCSTLPPPKRPPPPPPPGCSPFLPVCQPGEIAVYDAVKQCWRCEIGGGGGGDCGVAGTPPPPGPGGNQPPGSGNLLTPLIGGRRIVPPPPPPPPPKDSECCPKGKATSAGCRSIRIDHGPPPAWGYGCCTGKDTFQVCCFFGWDPPDVPEGVTLYGPAASCEVIQALVLDKVLGMCGYVPPPPPPKPCGPRPPPPRCKDGSNAEWDDSYCVWRCVPVECGPNEELYLDCVSGQWRCRPAKCQAGYARIEDADKCLVSCVRTRPDVPSDFDTESDPEAFLAALCATGLPAEQCTA